MYQETIWTKQITIRTGKYLWDRQKKTQKRVPYHTSERGIESRGHGEIHVFPSTVLLELKNNISRIGVQGKWGAFSSFGPYHRWNIIQTVFSQKPKWKKQQLKRLAWRKEQENASRMDIAWHMIPLMFSVSLLEKEEEEEWVSVCVCRCTSFSYCSGKRKNLFVWDGRCYNGL